MEDLRSFMFKTAATIKQSQSFLFYHELRFTTQVSWSTLKLFQRLPLVYALLPEVTQDASSEQYMRIFRREVPSFKTSKEFTMILLFFDVGGKPVINPPVFEVTSATPTRSGLKSKDKVHISPATSFTIHSPSTGQVKVAVACVFSTVEHCTAHVEVDR